LQFFIVCFQTPTEKKLFASIVS